MIAADRRPATINRQSNALRRLRRWAQGTATLAAKAARERPAHAHRAPPTSMGLTNFQVHALSRTAGASSRISRPKRLYPAL
jgi:hypothetical protein